MISQHQFAHLACRQFRNTQNDQIVFALQIRNIKIAINCQAYWYVGTVMLHACQRSLDKELVSGMTTGYKPKRSLHFHVTMADVSAGTEVKTFFIKLSKLGSKGTGRMTTVRRFVGDAAQLFAKLRRLTQIGNRFT